MTVIVDTAPIVSLADRRDRMYEPVLDVLRSEPGFLILPAPVTAEIDYFLGMRHGPEAQERFLRDIVDGVFVVESLTTSEHELAIDLTRRYADLRLGLADLSVIVLAYRFRTRRVLTFDHRDFRPVTPLQGGHFVLLPGDGAP